MTYVVMRFMKGHFPEMLRFVGSLFLYQSLLSRLKVCVDNLYSRSLRIKDFLIGRKFIFRIVEGLDNFLIGIF